MRKGAGQNGLEEYLAYQMDVVTSHSKASSTSPSATMMKRSALKRRRKEATGRFEASLPASSIRLSLKADAQAAYEGDPASEHPGGHPLLPVHQKPDDPPGRP